LNDRRRVLTEDTESTEEEDGGTMRIRRGRVLSSGWGRRIWN
jgi:hypothetical protein